MINFALRNPVIISVVMLIVCLFGILSLYRVPIQMIPDLDARVVSIATTWPGATPQDVEKEILFEQEDYLRNIPGLERMTSRASMGRAEIELEFPFGINISGCFDPGQQYTLAGTHLPRERGRTAHLHQCVLRKFFYFLSHYVATGKSEKCRPGDDAGFRRRHHRNPTGAGPGRL
jgi:hypothetical protein